MIELQSVVARFIELFGETAELVVSRAPGRVNLIGEHTDYNDGFVLPIAIERDVVLAGRAVDGDVASVFSMDFDRLVRFSLDDVRRDDRLDWLNYPKGVAALLQHLGVNVPAFEVVIAGDVPIGGGLSSSAALEVASVGFMLELAGSRMDPVATAKLARRVENEFVGVQCGIMDQFVAVMAKKDHALLIDCRDLSHRHIPTYGEDYEFVICDTGTRHELASSEYHNRQQECRRAVNVLASVRASIRTLRDATTGDLEAAATAAKLPEDLFRRARHVVTENARVMDAVEALETGDAVRFGQLMNASHESLRDDYEVSCPELDLMVELARSAPGVLGARMTGGGFGGCTVNLLHSADVPTFCREIVSRYTGRAGLEPCVIRTRAAAGMRTWKTNSQEASR